MNERFENAKLYLIDLLRAYGHRPVVVKVRMDGEPVEVMAKNMVKKQLTAAGILFPYGEGNKPNPLYRDRVPVLIKAIKSGAFRLEADAAVLTIDGKDERFAPEIILVTYQAKDGGHVMSEKGMVVSLDLTITDELRAEGIARDMVRLIQDARKQSGCEISDRIVLQLDGSYPEAYADYICSETLATLGTVTAPISEFEVEGIDGVIKAAIAKA